MNVNATVDVSPEDCLKALEYELCPPGDSFPPTDLVEKLQALHARVMKRWIAPADRCQGCSGNGECAGGSHSWRCTDCDGTGRTGGRRS